MAATSASSEETAGSNSTVAELVIRFTLADATPGARSSVRWMRALQAAQVIPVTGMVARSVAVAVLIGSDRARRRRGPVAFVGNGGGDAFRVDLRRIVVHLGAADLDGIDLDAVERGERLVHGVQAVAAGHAFDVQGEIFHG